MRAPDKARIIGGNFSGSDSAVFIFCLPYCWVVNSLPLKRKTKIVADYILIFLLLSFDENKA